MNALIQIDATRLPFADNSVDFVFGSPPYMDARDYGIRAKRGVNEWIEFMLRCTREAVRVSRGLVVWVVGGVTRKKCYWPGCEGLLYRWCEEGGHCWRPAFFYRNGIPGSGGKQWLRADTEYCLGFKKPGDLPWADNTAMGKKMVWPAITHITNRRPNGKRKDDVLIISRPEDRDAQGGRQPHASEEGNNASARLDKLPAELLGSEAASSGAGEAGALPERNKGSGSTPRSYRMYAPPPRANPGNVVRCATGAGHMGHALACKNEAPFPEKLAEFFVLSWCPPGGIVLDPFSGSGTTVAVAMKNQRIGIGGDIRFNQLQLASRRLAAV